MLSPPSAAAGRARQEIWHRVEEPWVWSPGQQESNIQETRISVNSEDEVVSLIAHPSACLPTAVFSLLGSANITGRGTQALQADGFLPS